MDRIARLFLAALLIGSVLLSGNPALAISNTSNYVNIIIVVDPQHAQASVLHSDSAIRQSLASYGYIKRSIGEKAYAMKVSTAQYKELLANQEYKVELDTPVHALLSDAVQITNITRVQAGQINGVNITGQGQAICIIDTGVNYTHADLGRCNAGGKNLSGNVLGYDLSFGPYPDLYNNTWKINITGFSKISLHFVNISTELGFDFVNILNGSNTTIASYSGSHRDLWAPPSDGDTIYINLVSDSSINGSGFGIDQVINGTAANAYNGTNCKVPAGWDFVNNDADPYDDHGHGTHVAGIAAANGTSLRGAAPDARIIAVKALDADGSGSKSDVVSAINWCVGNATKYNITVISMSLGGGAYTNYCDSSNLATADAINSATANNISVVVASGNSYSNVSISSPACITNATAIGSTTKSDQISTFTNLWNRTILLATGSSINSTYYDGGYATLSGTSMATPLAAGAFVLLNQEYHNKFGAWPATANITGRFNSTGVKITGRNNFVYSRIDVLGALSTFDAQNPQVVLLSPANGSRIKQGTQIKLNITDDLSLYSVIYSRNGTANISTTGLIDTTGWPSGNQTIAAYAWDIFDKYNTTIFQFNVMNSAPLASNITINPASAVRNTALNCNYTYSDADSDVQQTNATIINWYTGGLANSTFANQSTIGGASIFKNQTWMCKVKVFDGTDYGAAVDSSNLTISSIAPVAGIVYPNTTTNVSGVIQINVSATDGDGQADIQNVSFYYSNTTVWNFIGSTTAAGGQYYNITWNTSAVADGKSYQIRASVYDGINTTNTTSANTFIINNINEPPVVSVTAPNGGETWSGTKTITWSASDPDNDTLTVAVYYSKDSGGNWTLISNNEINDGTLSWNTANVADGTKYRINITASDGALTTSDRSDSDFTISNPTNSGNDNSNSGGTGGTTGGNVAGGGGGLGGDQAAATYTTVTAGEALTLDITKDLAITNIELISKSAATGVRLFVEKFDSQPRGLDSIKGIAYKFADIRADNLPSDAFDSVTIKFKVPKSWIKENNIDKKTIMLQHYKSGWQQLQTIKTGEDTDNLMFTATSPSLSFFAITGKKILGEEVTIESPENKTAGNATISGAVAAATGAAALKLPSINLSGLADALKARPYFLPNGLWVLIIVLAVVGALLRILKFLGRPRTPKAAFRQEIYQRYAPDVQAAQSIRKENKAQKFFSSLLKWMFTDTKQAKELEQQRKIKVVVEKEHPDFGFK